MPDSINEEIERALGKLADPVWTEDGWATVYVPVTRPMAETANLRPRLSGAVRPSDRYRYCEAASALTVRVGLATRAALGLASAELGLRRPGLRWFAASGPKDTATFTSNKDISGRIGAVDFTVWVRIGLGAGEAIRTAAHEARHFWQLLRDWPQADDSRAIEIDAERYVQDFWARHGSRLLGRTG